MGDKAESKARIQAAGVPTVPGYTLDAGLLNSVGQLADEIGYPVLVKAAAGGGGKGMRVVHAKGELGDAVESARREALNAFGDDRLLIEKYLADAHHIEFQVFGDKYEKWARLQLPQPGQSGITMLGPLSSFLTPGHRNIISSK
jgi:acetyl/propionyl-CoA carboxylase alpha subunit